MLTFIFTAAENMEVALNRELEINKALPLLHRINQEAIDNEDIRECEYELKNEGEFLYGSSLSFPVVTFDLLDQIRQDLVESEGETDDVLSFLAFLESQIPTSKKNKREVKKPKEKKEKQKREPKSLIDRFPFLLKLPKIMTILVGTAVVVTAVLAVGYAIYVKTIEKPSFEEYIRQEQFIEAGKEYPKKQVEIESKLEELTRTKDKKYLDQLIRFNEKYPTVQGDFDCAMFDANYSEATSVFQKNRKKLIDDPTRATLAGYAFLKQKEIKAAEKVAEEINSVELEKYIETYKQLQLTIDETQKQKELLQKEPVKNKEKIEQAIDTLFEAKEELENL